MNKALKTQTIVPLKKRDIDLICDGIVGCFDENNKKETIESLRSFFQSLPPVEAATFYNYLTKYTPIKARPGLVELIATEFHNLKKPEKNRPKRPLDLNTLIAENERKDHIILNLKKEIKDLKETLNNIYIGFKSPEEVLEDLKAAKIPLWENRPDSAPQNPLDFYQTVYQSFHNRMYQFILRKYDPGLIKAMDGKIAYLRKKGKHITLSDYIPPKKKKNVRKKLLTNPKAK